MAGFQRFSHLGLCVADLERSLRFYCEGLEFREVSRLGIGGEATETLLELPGARLEARYLERDGLRLELLHFPEPGHSGSPAPRPMNALGFTHLSFRVEALDAAAHALAALGGSVLTGTKVWNEEFGAGAVFVLDPDGTRIELVASPGDPARLPGQS